MLTEPYSWWASLRHGGMLIAPSRLSTFFPEKVDPLPKYLSEQLRRELNRWEEVGAAGKQTFLNTVLEKICGLNGASHARWIYGNDVGTEWSFRAITGELVKPRRLWQGPHDLYFPVFADNEKRLGVGRGRRSVSRVIEWLRSSGNRIALLTNYRQWRLIYAGLDHDAWIEWDTDLWFEEGHPSLQVDALQALISPNTLIPESKDKLSPLLSAIEATRKGQAELSASLGERVRQAVELLIQSHAGGLSNLDEEIKSQYIYIAACRVIMRMVVILFAEARDLLPREEPIYHQSYGLQGLREHLERFGVGTAAERLRHRYGSWPRILGLFRLVYEGSHHEALGIPRYGGGLFVKGDPESNDPILRAIAVFEDRENAPNDHVVFWLLQLLCRSRVRVRQGRSSTIVDAPVDFSDLSSEYIGILYEGLLDFELRQAEEDEPIIFLNLGNQPALPLDRLEDMNDQALKSLLDKLKKADQDVVTGTEENVQESENQDAIDVVEVDEELDQEEISETEDNVDLEDAYCIAHERVMAWAVRAVEAGKLVRRPRSRSLNAQDQYQRNVEDTAKRLIIRLILPREWYLVRWGGTRKGSGTFYTRSGLAVPTVHRTLRPLAFSPPTDSNGRPNKDAPAVEWAPKPPNEIVRLKICDTSVGSGSFLVAALRFLTDSLFNSLYKHGWIISNTQRSIEAPGLENRPTWFHEVVQGLPEGSEEAEKYIKARLKRCIVERCIYGVDNDPLAVELARLSLWVETMDRDLPFEFLDHKLKVGNSLIGCWFDQFSDYPIMAWEREGGDKNHDNGVHFEKGAWTKAIKEYRKSFILPRLEEFILKQSSILPEVEGQKPEAIHDDAVKQLEKIHSISVLDQEERARLYKDEIEKHSALRRLKTAFDAWCAIWFWPADKLDIVPNPQNMENPDNETGEIIQQLTYEYKFFHWELEFPDVFHAFKSGFDAIFGNPPWDIQKPSSKEFFSNRDPLYRTYGKQEALQVQKNMFVSQIEYERLWLEYNAKFKALSNWCKNVKDPFSDQKSLGRDFPHSGWQLQRSGRTCYADPNHPFRHQGSADINTYKMFLEVNHALLCDDGILGLIVPSGLYTDKGSTNLRELFINRSQWRWLFGFENREKIFDIHRSYKFCPVIIKKSGTTDVIRTAFMHRDIRDWEEGERHSIPYSKEQIIKFSPNTRSLLEVQQKRDLEILEKIYANSVLLGDQSADGWGIKYSTEFHMTNDSHLFHPRPWWEERGYKPDQYGRWIGPDGDVALPLYEGRMIGQFDFSEKGWVSGRGRSAVWRTISWESKSIDPQFLMVKDNYLGFKDREGIPKKIKGLKLVFMAIGSATNIRSMISAVIKDFPCGNSVPILSSNLIPNSGLAIVANLNSLVYDFSFRARLGGLNLNYFILAESPLLNPKCWLDNKLALFISGRLGLTHYMYGPEWLRLIKTVRLDTNTRMYPWKRYWAISKQERLRLRCALDAIIAELYGFEYDDLAWILKDCDHPVENLSIHGFTRTLDPKGFWRIDQDKEPELRHSTLTLAAFHNLKTNIADNDGDRNEGIKVFCSQNEGEGWMLPETLCLADLGLGHDERAKKPQSVRDQMGERFLPWQLEQSVEESWSECEMHARNILGEDGFKKLMNEIKEGNKAVYSQEQGRMKPDYGDQQLQKRLFPRDGGLFGDLIEDPVSKSKKKK